MGDTLISRIRVAHPHVRVDGSVLSGSPHVAGSRVPVRRLWAWHRGGTSVETLVRRYPNLGPARILDALSFAYDNQDLIEADLAREQELFAETGGPIVGARPLAQLALPFDPNAPGAAPVMPVGPVSEKPAPVAMSAMGPMGESPKPARASRRR